MTVAAVFIPNPSRRLQRSALVVALAALAPLTLTPPDAFAAGAMTGQTEPNGALHVPPRLMLAQAAIAPNGGARTTQVAPGETLSLPADVASDARTTKNYVIVTKVPSWLTLQPAEKVGEGVWLVSPQNAASTKMTVAQGASGSRDIAFTIVDKDGAMVKEVVVSFSVAQATGTVKAAPGVAVAQAQPAAPAQQKPETPAAPAAAAEPKAAAPATAQPAAPAAPANGAPGQASTKSWTDFIAGRKPAEGGGAAAKPAEPPAGTGTKKSEAELITYAKHLVRECTTCHSLYGQDEGIPLMIGLTKDRFLDTMDLYRTGKRDNIAMQSVAQSLTDEDVLALAIYLGRIKPPVQTASRGSASGSTPDTTGALVLRAPTTALQPGSKDAVRIDRWVKRAEKMLESGEIAQARLLLERATEMGHAIAAMTLASSFDPNILPWRPEMGMEADPARAKQLYLHAIQLGAGAEAQRRLSELP